MFSPFVKLSSSANYSYIRNYPMATTAFKNSIYLSIGSATFVMLLTSVIAWITVKSKLPGRALLDNMTFIIYGTLWVLLLAYMTKFMPYGIRAGLCFNDSDK